MEITVTKGAPVVSHIHKQGSCKQEPSISFSGFTPFFRSINITGFRVRFRSVMRCKMVFQRR